MGVVICCFLSLLIAGFTFDLHIGSIGCFLKCRSAQRMAQTGREVTCLGVGLVPIVHSHVITGRGFSADMIALMCCLRSLGFCFHTAVQGFRN